MPDHYCILLSVREVSFPVPSFVSRWLCWDPGTEVASLPQKTWYLKLATDVKSCTSSSLRSQVSAFSKEYWSDAIFHFMTSNPSILFNISFHFTWSCFHFLILLLIYHPAFALMTVSDILCRNPATPHDICSFVWGILCIPHPASPLYSELHLP